MAVVYFDSNAFAKLLVEEVGSDLAAKLWDGCDAAVASRLWRGVGEHWDLMTRCSTATLRCSDAYHDTD